MALLQIYLFLPLQVGKLPESGANHLWNVLPKGVKFLFTTLKKLDPTYTAAYLQIYRACFHQLAAARSIPDPFLIFETLRDLRAQFGTAEEPLVLLLYERDITLLMLLSIVASVYAFFLWPCDHLKNPQAPFDFSQVPHVRLVGACDIGLRVACDMHAPKDRDLKAPRLPMAPCLATTFVPALVNVKTALTTGQLLDPFRDKNEMKAQDTPLLQPTETFVKPVHQSPRVPCTLVHILTPISADAFTAPYKAAAQIKRPTRQLPFIGHTPGEIREALISRAAAAAL